MGSQTARSVDLLREMGFLVERVEQTYPGTFIKRDLFNAFDLVAIHPDNTGVLGVQVTTGPNKAAHVTKLREIEAVWVWLRAGNWIDIHSWRKARERTASGSWGRPKWANVVVPIRLEDLEPEPDWDVVRRRLAVEAQEKKRLSLERRRETLERKARAQTGPMIR